MHKEVDQFRITSEFRREQLGGKAVRHGSKLQRSELATALVHLAHAPDPGLKVHT